MTKKIHPAIYWTPRILSIFLLCFLALFSLDVISPELSFWQIALGLFMHNIPVFILVIVLLISWKHELVGGIVFLLAGILYVLRIVLTALLNPVAWYMAVSALVIAGPALLIGVLFCLNWVQKRKLEAP